MGCRRAVSLLAALLLVSSSLTAHAADAVDETEPLPIALEFSGCEALDQRALLKLLAIEFQTLKVPASEPIERVRIACGASVAQITIDARPAGKEVDLAATAASAWPRLLALSVSEIVIESRARVVRPAARAAAQSRALEMPKITPQIARMRLFAGIAERRAVRSATWLSGPELGFEFAWTRHLTLLADARAEFGSTDTDVAEVHWVSARAALAALIGGRAAAWQFGLGPGFCLGYLGLSPTVSQAAATGHVVSGAWGGPELVARAEYDFSRRWFARLSVDSGIVTWPVAGLVNGQRRLLDAGGGWISSSVALGALF
jgi:hypothetical protein